MEYLLYTLIFNKLYFSYYGDEGCDRSFVRCQLINKDIYNIYKSLLYKDIAALKLKKYFTILEYRDLDLLNNILYDKFSYTYIIKSIGNLEFIPEFNYFNKIFNRENSFDICLRHKEIDNLDIFKPYNLKIHNRNFISQMTLGFKSKTVILVRLSKLGLHYPIRSKSKYYFTF